MMKSKRGQGELITTVLIILVVLAAVAIVATFIVRNVRTSTETAGQKVNCAKLDVSIDRAVVNETTVSVKRGATGNELNVSMINIYVNSALTNNTAINALETKIVYVGALASGNIVEIAPVMSDGTLCDMKDKVTVA